MEKGEVLGERYELLAPIAEGATGTVWDARDRAAGNTVAIKAVSLEREGWRAEVRDRFEQEARLLALAPHDNLVGVRGFGETEDGHLYLVLERLYGETLAQRIARPPKLSWREAGDIALALARGVAALHERGIVHRDLKPANVVLHRRGPGDPVVPKIIDLGISKARAAAIDPVLRATLTATGQVLGTPQYMSYEQALGEPDIDARSDVWSLGIVLYEMLAGQSPFVAPNVNAVLAAIRKGNPPPLRGVAPGVPASLDALTLKCLARERDARFVHAGALVRALEEVLRARLPGRSVVALAAGLVVALVAAAAVLALRPPAPQSPPSSAAAAPPSVASEAAAAEPPSEPPPSTASARVHPEAPRPRSRSVTRINDAGF